MVVAEVLVFDLDNVSPRPVFSRSAAARLVPLAKGHLLRI